MCEIVRLRCGMVNCYLLRQGEAAILVDAANKGDAARLESRLRERAVCPEALSLMLITHGHADHIGAIDYFRDQYRTPIALHPADRQARPMAQRGLIGGVLGPFSNRGLKRQKPLLEDVSLEDGMSLADYGIDARVVELPGHTAGSVGVLTGDGRLVAGDMYMNFVGPAFAYIAEDFEKLNETHQKLVGLGVETVYPGHGGSFAFRQVQPPKL